ncbi:fatty acid/phospholipid synthesis protein PlsX [Mycoplasmopsis maculosa]|uniref:Phosphate acyltransferase n=1 Tax=Mycoplasmopsis maculosa TaxID=114885 RepID=A0A449B5E6_9BACT|nr:phosphate acyltransferase PlsX [Mycoplasmopsis maculosa]VEU75827.1 fatty acid/phospholipid synthesis protein PlsX [Mycoplasmopsis maculosa]
MYKIAFDLNGNDRGIKPGILASVEFLKDNRNYEITLIGPEEEIKDYLKLLKYNGDNLKIIDNQNTPTDKKNFRQSLRENTSMNNAIDLVANNKADVLLSAGDSGTYLACTTFKLKRLEGVSRAAFMPLMPSIIGKKWLLLDVGANIETKVEYLIEWAKIANVYAKALLKKNNPDISLINIGTEDYKGPEFTKEASKILGEDKNLNYKGYIEPRDLLQGNTDIAVVDGYGGNLVLKSLEGAILSFKDLLKSKIMLKPIRKVGYLLAKGAFKDVAETLDYRNVGAAWVIGVNGLAIKCHGNSDEKAFLGAFKQIKLVLENSVMDKVRESLDAKL